VEAGEAARKREIFVSHGASAGDFHVMARSAGSAHRDKRAWRACFLGFQTYSYTNRAPATSASPPPPDLRLASAIGTRVAAGPAPRICRQDQGRHRSSASPPPSGPRPPPNQHVNASPPPCLRRSFFSSAWPPSPGPCHPLLLLCCIHKVSSSSPLLHLLQLGELRMCEL
jgi:hypothetical protein